MFGSRRGRPSLISRAAQTAARTAVITGTATAVSGKVAARQARAGHDASPVTPAAVSDAEPTPPVPSGPTEADLARLQKLAEMHQAGILTAEEFAEQKARILA